MDLWVWQDSVQGTCRRSPRWISWNDPRFLSEAIEKHESCRTLATGWMSVIILLNITQSTACQIKLESTKASADPSSFNSQFLRQPSTQILLHYPTLYTQYRLVHSRRGQGNSSSFCKRAFPYIIHSHCRMRFEHSLSTPWAGISRNRSTSSI